MSQLVYITTEGEEAIGSATLETLLQVRGTTTARLELAAFGLSADYETDGTEVCFWELGYQTTDGTATGASEVSQDPVAPTTVVTGFHSFSAEGTKGGIVRQGHFNLNGGYYVESIPMGEGPIVDDATTSRLGLWVTTTAAVNMAAWMAFRVVTA